MEIVLGILIPFFWTTLGAGMVFLMKNKLSKKVEKLLLGFASGVMIAASIWSLIMPKHNTMGSSCSRIYTRNIIIISCR